MIFFVNVRKYLLTINPIKTGNKTTFVALNNRPFKSTFISSPDMLVIKIGVKTTPIRVEIKVIVTEKATFKLDRYAITFDAVPPGQHETKINPTAKKSGNCKILEIAHPKKGMIENWVNTPIIVHRGFWNKILKSVILRVKPIPGIMIPNPRVIKLPLNQVKNSGLNKAEKEKIITHKGKRLTKNLK